MKKNKKEDAVIKKAFDDVRDSHLPAQPDLPIEKPREDVQLEQERERVEKLNAQKNQFRVVPCIPVDIFLSRDEIGEDESSSIFLESAFQEDVDSYKTVLPTRLSEAAFGRLYAPRTFVYKTKQFRQSFEDNSDLLYHFMDQHDIARVPNAMKRIKKGETANLRLPRYSAEQIKQRIDSGKDDLFGYLSLLPHSLTKSSKSPYQRKMIILHKFQEMMQDCDYSNRTGYQERMKLNDIQKKLSELQIFIDTPKPQSRSLSVPTRKIQSSYVPAALKSRDTSNYASDSEPVIPRRIEKESRPSTSSTENRDLIADNVARLMSRRSSDSCSSEDLVPGKPHKVNRNVDPNVERERILREKRKEAAIRREAEYLENQNREKEEHARRQAAELEEIERRRVEIERQKAEQFEERQRQEEERRREAIRIAEEFRVAQEREKERLKRLEEEREQRKIAEDFEKLKRRMQEAAQEARMNSKPQTITVWRFLPVRKPSNWSEHKEKYFNHYNWSADSAQRDVERRKVPRAAPGNLISIPHQNNAETKVTPLTLPKVSLASKPSSSLSAGSFKKPGPVVPVYRKADQNQLEKLIEDIKKLTGPGRRSIANYVSMTNNEVNYQSFHLHIFKNSFKYPFGTADGFYWPLLFVLEDSSSIGHVRSLVACNSFSGKYASRYLLTTPLQEDSASKKFDASYHDCGGDWAQYSQKPGRFSKRLGYRAHYSKSKDSFDVQKQRARDKLNNDYDNERREQAEFGRYIDEYRQRGDGNRNNEYKKQITTHLRQLVKDARLDVYSLKESDQDGNCEYLTHPGTRDSPVLNHWHTHGYNKYLRTRDREYGKFMYRACDRYESLLKHRTSANVDQFNEWCFTPMLASLHYQSKYVPYDVFSSKQMRELNERYKRYHGLLRERKFSVDQAVRVCRLTPLDKKQWTILHDQLVSHFRDFPTVFQIMYNPNKKMITKVDNVVTKLLETEFRDRSNSWFTCSQVHSNRRYL